MVGKIHLLVPIPISSPSTCLPTQQTASPRFSFDPMHLAHHETTTYEHTTTLAHTQPSSGARVLGNRECVDAIVSHIPSEPDLHHCGIPSPRWFSCLKMMMTVNIHFFFSVSALLWSYVPSPDVLSAMYMKIDFEEWRRRPSSVQYL